MHRFFSFYLGCLNSQGSCFPLLTVTPGCQVLKDISKKKKNPQMRHRARNVHLTGKGRGKLQRGAFSFLFSEASRTASRFLERGSQQPCYEGCVMCTHNGIFLSWLPQLPWAPELVVTGSQWAAVVACQAPAVTEVGPFSLGCFHSCCRR